MPKQQTDASLRTKRIANIYLATAIVLTIAFAGSAALNFYLPYKIAANLPRSPVPNEGRTVLYKLHGQVMYVTGKEHYFLMALFYGQFIFGIGAALLFEGSRRARGGLPSGTAS